MSFLDPDDYFLIMYYPPMEYRPEQGIIRAMKYLSGDDLKRIRDAGPKTVMIQTNWEMLEPEQGKYQWDYLDTMVRNALQADMKVLLHEYVFGPVWCPKEWYLQSLTHKNDFNQLSIWNKDARHYLDQFLRQVAARYVSDKVNLACSMSIVGESYLPFMMENPFHDPAAVESYRAFVSTEQAEPREADPGSMTEKWLKNSIIAYILYRNALLMTLNHRQEIWHSAHHTLGWNPKKCGAYAGNGASYIRDVLDAEREAFPIAKFNGIQYTYWWDGNDEQFYKDYRQAVRDDRDKYNIDFYIEAHYCTGLAHHTRMLIEEGYKGFILAPISPNMPETKLEDWMIKIIRESYETLRVAKNQG